MNKIYLPSKGADDWQWLLAQPGKQWKHTYSAMSLADSWEGADGVPAPVATTLSASSELASLEMVLGIPEHQTPLPGGARDSQTDLLVLARNPAGELICIAVEGKAEEPFGNQTVSEWRENGSEGKQERIAYLLETLGLPDDEHLGSTAYQLLHRTASAVIEARRFNASRAVMMVHSFSPSNSSFSDYRAFAELFGATPEIGEVVAIAELDGVKLFLGWTSDHPADRPDPYPLGSRFSNALAYASRLHASQSRKETEIPYVSHLMAVASLVLEDGGDEDEAIAALLHDAVEDQGGAPRLNEIRKQFGDRVASIVDACSDTDVAPKPPWRERKEAYISHLRDPGLPNGTLRVSLADKLHNARSILFDHRAGRDVFSRFNAGREDQAWYYRGLADAFEELAPGPMAAEFRRVVDELFELGDDQLSATTAS